MKIIIRSDASNEPNFGTNLGTGHLLRMNMLGQHLKKSAKVSFLTRTQRNFDVSKKILSSENIIKLTNDSLIYPNSTNEIKTIIKQKPNLVIFDRLNTSIQLIDVLKKNKLKVISFDDLGLGSTLTDITIISLFKTKYKNKNIHCGYKYLILGANTVKKKKKKIFISFGGYDHRGLCEKVLKRINFNKFLNYSFLIICGDDAYKKRLELIKKKKKIINLTIISRTKNFLEHLSESKVSITSGGLTLFESIRLKNKCLAIPQYKHQSYNIEKLTKLGLTKKINLMSNINDILEETLNKNFKSSLIDSNGMRRVIKLFKNRNLL